MQKNIQEQLKDSTKWIIGLALVKFDFDEGQLVEEIYPDNVFSKAQQKSIAMLSFPDSNSFDTNQGTLKYVFRMKRENGKSLFAFVCFKQKKDPTIFRGYFQKSLVILSEIPLMSFFSTLSEFLVFKLFGVSSQKLKLENIYQQISTWAIPQPFACLQLNILGYSFNITVPTYKHQHLLELNRYKNILNAENLNQIGYFQETNILESYKKVLLYLWPIWEIVLLNKPLMIIAQNPSLASNAILSAISLISPLMYISNYKPYMTVYDSDFQDIQNQLDERPEKLMMIIGVTNPLFLKSLKKMPNIVSLTSPSDTKGLVTRVRPDKQFCKLVVDLQNAKQPQQLVQSLIRRHFRKLTEVFLQQFQLYFLQQKNDLKRYQKDQFMKFVKSQKIDYGECFQSRRSLIKLYSEFCESVNFHKYIMSRNIIKTF